MTGSDYIAYYRCADEERYLVGTFALYRDIERLTKRPITQLLVDVVNGENLTRSDLIQILTHLDPDIDTNRSTVDLQTLLYGILYQILGLDHIDPNQSPPSSDTDESPDWSSFIAQASIYFGISVSDAEKLTITDYNQLYDAWCQKHGIKTTQSIDYKSPDAQEFLARVREQNRQEAEKNGI